MIWVLVGIIVVLLVVVGVVAMQLQRERRRRELKEEFGPEYHRVMAEADSPAAGERQLREQSRRRQQFQIRELEPAAREQYRERWRVAQRRFVDEPAAAVAEADVLVREVMSQRGYPVDESFEQRAADLSADHPDLVENYRAANAISRRSAQGQASTEDLRQSLVHFRALFDELLGGEEGSAGPRGDQDAGAPVQATRRQ